MIRVIVPRFLLFLSRVTRESPATARRHVEAAAGDRDRPPPAARRSAHIFPRTKLFCCRIKCCDDHHDYYKNKMIIMIISFSFCCNDRDYHYKMITMIIPFCYKDHHDHFIGELHVAMIIMIIMFCYNDHHDHFIGELHVAMIIMIIIK